MKTQPKNNNPENLIKQSVSLIVPVLQAEWKNEIKAKCGWNDEQYYNRHMGRTRITESERRIIIDTTIKYHKKSIEKSFEIISSLS